jgi:carboxymethylenebutenolidase
MFECMGSLSNTLVVRDTAGMLGFLAKEPAARDGAIGYIGYCMSGQFVVSVAGMFPEDVAAAASLYGVGIVTEGKDSPHLLAAKIKGELYFGFAERDEYVPANVVEDLRAVLDAQKAAYRLDVWPGTGHGFCFPERDTYAKDAAEQVWGLVFDLFDRRLGQAGAA